MLPLDNEHTPYLYRLYQVLNMCILLYADDIVVFNVIQFKNFI